MGILKALEIAGLKCINWITESDNPSATAEPLKGVGTEGIHAESASHIISQFFILIGYPINGYNWSEMITERSTGSVFQAIYLLLQKLCRNSLFLSNQSMWHLPGLPPSLSACKPDLAIVSPVLNEYFPKKDENLLGIVLTLAEAKTTKTLTFGQIEAQVAFPIHATLSLLMMLHCLKYGDNYMEHKLPSWYYIIAATYTTEGVSFIAHWPVAVEDGEGPFKHCSCYIETTSGTEDARWDKIFRDSNLDNQLRFLATLFKYIDNIISLHDNINGLINEILDQNKPSSDTTQDPHSDIPEEDTIILPSWMTAALKAWRVTHQRDTLKGERKGPTDSDEEDDADDLEELTAALRGLDLSIEQGTSFKRHFKGVRR
ncbi:hypothetical protein AX16_008371 [Volvariella volvacea WC 439]|nr:hypothetical protein AX16_008371 [Volvariella volvacea WC 439]